MLTDANRETKLSLVNQVTMPPPIDNKFSKAAKIALINLDLTVVELAQKLDRPRQTVSAVVNGSRRYPKLRKLVAKQLKCAA